MFSTTAGLVLPINLISTVAGLSNAGYVVESELFSTTAGLVLPINLISTVAGLGSAGYISSQQLGSTVIGLQTYISSFIDPVELASTVANLISTTAFTNALVSTVANLGTAGYISSSQLTSSIAGSVLPFQLRSTVVGLGSAGYISSSQLTSTVAGSVLPFQLGSTVVGLGSAGYISSSQLTSTVAGSVLPFQLGSTVVGLGSAGYLSTTLSTNRFSTIYTNQVLTSTLWLANKSGGPFTGGGAQDTFYQLQVSDASLYYRPTLLPIPATFPGTPVILGSNLFSTVAGLSNVAVTKLIAGSNITISPVGGVGTVTVNAVFNDLVSTGFLDTQLTSTVAGLGTAGYLSGPIIKIDTLLGNTAHLSTVSLLNYRGFASPMPVDGFEYTLFVSDANLYIGDGGLLNPNGLPALSNLIVIDTLLYSTSQGLYDNLSNWANYPAVTEVTLNSNNPTIRNPSTNTLMIYSENTLFRDSNFKPASINTGLISFEGISSQSVYFLGDDPLFTGTISSFALGTYTPSLTFEAGSLYLSSVWFGNFGGTVTGELTTDATATDLYWKGSKLNNQTGGGTTVNTSNLVSTVVGLGSAGYISSSQLTSSIAGSVLPFQLVSTTVGLTSTVYQWAFYPALSSIVFANESEGTLNSIITNGLSILNLQTNTGVFVTNSSLTTKPVIASEYIVQDAFPGGYVYSLAAGSYWTGTISSATITTQDDLGNSNVGPLYLSSLYLGNTGGTIYGEITTDDTGTNLFWKGTQLNVAAGVTTGELVSTVDNLAQAGYVSTSQLVSTIVEWSRFPAVSPITLFENDTRIINPTPGTGVNLQTVALSVADVNQAPGFLDIGTLNFLTSTSQDIYTIGNDSFFTGTVSSLAIVLPKQNETRSLYLSSLYLGNFGGTIYGEITTDDTGTNLFWKGTQLNGAGITTGDLVSTTGGLQTNFLGQQAQVSSLYVNMDPNTAPFWDSNVPAYKGNDPEPAPLAVDVYGSLRVLKNLYVGSTTTKIASGGIQAPNISAGTINISTLFLNGQIITTVLVSTGVLQSTIEGLGTLGYISSAQLTSTTAGSVLPFQLVSTVIGLSNAGYVIESELFSTTAGLVVPANLVSTVAGLSNVAVTQIVAGSNISISPVGGVGVVTINGSGSSGGLTTIPANLSTSAFFTSSVLASTISARSVSTGFITLSSATLFDPLNANTGNSLAVASTFLYFNSYIIGGTRVASQQWVVF